MTLPSRPSATSLYGKENWLFLTTVASALFIPTAAECVAGSSLDITLIAFADTDKPTQTTNLVQQERRYGDTSRAQFVGESQVAGGNMHYQFAAQAATGSAGKALYEKIPFGTTGFLVNRLGVAIATAPTTGQFVNCYPVQFGRSFPLPAGADETAESGMTVTFAVTDPNPAISVALT